MGVEKTQVRFDVDSAAAKRAAQSIKREMNDIEREAGQAERAVNGARSGHKGLGARFKGLLDRARARGFEIRDSGATVGRTWQLGTNGFSVRDEFKQTHAGAFIAGYAVYRGSQGFLNDVADFRDQYRGFDVERYLRSRAPNLLGDAANLTQPLVQTIARYAPGYTGDNATLAAADVGEFIRWWWASRFSDDAKYKSPIDEAIRQQAAQLKAAREAQEQLDAKRTEARDKAFARLDEILESQLAGLKTDIIRPKNVKLTRELNQQFQRRWDDVRERAARRNNVAQKETYDRVNQMEGR